MRFLRYLSKVQRRTYHSFSLSLVAFLGIDENSSDSYISRDFFFQENSLIFLRLDFTISRFDF